MIIKRTLGLCILAVKLSDNMKCKLTLLDSVLKNFNSICGFKASSEYNDLNIWGNKIQEGKLIWKFR